jgi:hypothetical protein
LSWVFPDEPLRALPPEIFMRDYYQPRLLPKLLGGEKLREIRTLSSLNRSQPGVEIVKVEPEAEGELVSVTVKVKNTSSKVQKDASGKHLESGAFDLHLFRDGQLVGQWPETVAAETSPAGADSRVELESWRNLHEIKLVNGEYIHTFHHVRLRRRAGVEKEQFTAYAFNSDRVKSLTTPPLEYSLPKVSKSTAAVVRRAYLISNHAAKLFDDQLQMFDLLRLRGESLNMDLVPLDDQRLQGFDIKLIEVWKSGGNHD